MNALKEFTLNMDGLSNSNGTNVTIGMFYETFFNFIKLAENTLKNRKDNIITKSLPFELEESFTCFLEAF
ncbi:hypothetical protein RclHR1_05390005 [Rhizophagus clarus]|uniref:Uncharacterized protein n=1 Tax=Rhizophagus clarus TaxID=94130 RepID=A0A2Z6RSR7_9GLOM|nr:hypothetical protein RclHR1_05390005 [Rhizophagus clarus]